MQTSKNLDIDLKQESWVNLQEVQNRQSNLILLITRNEAV